MGWVPAGLQPGTPAKEPFPWCRAEECEMSGDPPFSVKTLDTDFNVVGFFGFCLNAVPTAVETCCSNSQLKRREL